jgi:hypothetical protein
MVQICSLSISNEKVPICPACSGEVNEARQNMENLFVLSFDGFVNWEKL